MACQQKLSTTTAGYYGKGQSFTLLDNESKLNHMIGRMYKEINNEYATESIIKEIRTCITYIKNMMLTKEEIKKLDVNIEQIQNIYDQYCSELKNERLMDYDDQMIYAHNILNKVPEVLEHFQDKYRYICVDESQDTSKIQHAIIRKLAQKHGNIFMVGDEDQSIYGFRAAYPEALMNFSKDYPNAKIMMLETNYRSTKEIVAVSNAFVSNNRFRYKKSIMPVRGSGFPIQVIDVDNRLTQYKYLYTVAQTCEKETAILFRNNDSAIPLIDMFERSGIPYNCRQFDATFFSNPIVVDITDIINFAYNPHDANIFMRIYYKLDSYLDKKSVIDACEQSKRTGKSILEELIKMPTLNSWHKSKVANLLTLFSTIKRINGKKALQIIWTSVGYGNYAISKKLDTSKFDILCMIGENEESPRNLLRRIGELQEIVQNHTNNNASKLILSTIHSSKGLEYDRVFLLDIYDGLLPLKAIQDATAPDEIKQHEEDRRLYYVGMTRAKNELYLLRCRNVESAFTNEIIRYLPKENAGKNIDVPISKQSLIDSTYTHSEKGKGSIIAQCGNSVLVEYENNKELQLMTTSQLSEQGFLNIKRESVNRPVNKVIYEKPKETEIKPDDKTMLLLAEFVPGKSVIHTKFGEGVITNKQNNYIDIRFHGINQDKKFDLIMMIQKGYIKLL